MPIYIGGALTLAWGIAHLFPTKAVVRDFGDLTNDNRHIIQWNESRKALRS